MPRFDVICYEQLTKMAHEHEHPPTWNREKSSTTAQDHEHSPSWNREQLIEQFRRIDCSTRGQAATQLDALERSFQEIFLAPLPPTRR